jgi:4,5-dihydroxyphthalate decarboxylase
VSKLPLTFACGPYDRMEALRTGVIGVEGIDLNYLNIQGPREIFDRMVGGQEFDLSELSSSEFISQTGAGKCPFVALPVFPSKAFRHGFICVNRHAGIRTPKDLEGKRVGTPLYTQTAAIFIRGMLAHEYGVDLEKIRWVQGAVEKAGSHGSPHALPLLKPVPMEINKSGKSLGDLLALGEIDAILGSRLPETLGKHPDVVRLFPNYREVEREYFRKTRIHPIMHLVAIRKDVYERNTWIANSLYKAFDEAKNWAVDQMRFSGAQRLMLPWLFADIDEIDEVFGGDPWPYGVDANRPTLEALVTYMHEQHFIPRKLTLEELFLPVRVVR